eukprot:9205051-Pyramimonas_sp.AAC.1
MTSPTRNRYARIETVHPGPILAAASICDILCVPGGNIKVTHARKGVISLRFVGSSCASNGKGAYNTPDTRGLVYYMYYTRVEDFRSDSPSPVRSCVK